MEKNEDFMNVDMDKIKKPQELQQQQQQHEKGEWILTLATVILAIFTVLITLIVLKKRRKEQIEDFDVNTKNEQYKLLMLCTVTLGILIWPMIWKKIVSFDTLATMPILWTAFLYPLLMTISDVVGNSNTDNINYMNDSENYNSRNGSSKINKYQTGKYTYDAVNMITIAVALGSLFSSANPIKILEKSKTLISIAVMLLVIFVLPSPISNNSQSPTKVIVSSGQKVVFNYAIAFLIAAGLMHFKKL